MKIALVGNTDFSIYNYRFELCLALLNKGHDIIVVCPSGNYTKRMIDAGCKHINISINAHGLNPFQDLKLKRKLISIFKKEKPDYVCGFTIKPNIYGAWACKKIGIPFIANITGLGPKVEKRGLIHLIALALYKIAFAEVYLVFCQNEANKAFFEKHNIAKDRLVLLPGSGVNLKKFDYKTYPSEDTIRFAFVSRIRKDKGINQFIEAAKAIKHDYKNVEFHVFGKCDTNYLWIQDEPSIVFHGMVDDTVSIYESIHCLVFPSYYSEGLANVLLEASATGRPVITTDRAGCREAVDNNVSGYIIQEKNIDDLIKTIKTFLSLSNSQRAKMGMNARKKMEKEFSRDIVINKYLSCLI